MRRRRDGGGGRVERPRSGPPAREPSPTSSETGAGGAASVPVPSPGGVDETLPTPSKPAPPGQSQSRLPQDLHWTALLRRRPWVLVPRGSIGGYFDFVPEPLRVGPWSPVAAGYLVAIAGAGVAAGGHLWVDRDRRWHQSYLPALREARYPPPGSAPFVYNAAVCVWMAGVAVSLARGPRGLYAWSTYTVQSWTMLAVRHGLSAAAGAWGKEHPSIVVLAELARFPAACSAAITFAVWNFAVQPFLYVHLRDPERRRGFVQFCTSFRLINLHVLNLAFAAWNGLWASPPRALVWLDFYWAFVSVAAYIVWYLLVLDRLGVHLYPVFSPRAHGAVVAAAWTSLLAIYVGTYYAWRHLMMPPGSGGAVVRP